MRHWSSFLLVVLTTLSTLVPSPAGAAALAHLVSLSGEVTVLTKGQAAWHPGHDREELMGGDTVRTGAKASATVERNDGTAVELMPFAELSIDDEQGFLVTAGRVWSHFIHAVGAPFFIRTPNATALIRGTTLGVGFDQGQSRVVVVEGLVEVRGKDQSRQEVPAGFRVDVSRLGALGRLEHAEERELAEGHAFRARRGLDQGVMAPKTKADAAKTKQEAVKGKTESSGNGKTPATGGGFKTQAVGGGTAVGADKASRMPRTVRPDHRGPRHEPRVERLNAREHRMEKLDRKTGARLQIREQHSAVDRAKVQQLVDKAQHDAQRAAIEAARQAREARPSHPNPDPRLDRPVTNNEPKPAPPKPDPPVAHILGDHKGPTK